MNIKKIKVPKRMRVPSMTSSTKLKGMKVSRSIKNIKKINLKKKLPSLKKGKPSAPSTGVGSGAAGSGGVVSGVVAHPGGRMGLRRSSSKWISVVRKKILRPKFSGHKGSNNKNIIIIHNNTSITGNEEDNRTSCATTVKEVVIIKEDREDETSIDSAAPPPHDQASKEEETEEEEEEEESHGGSEISRFKEDMAALLIQSVFRGHLARRANRALRSLVKLQAVVRGACVRRQARIALHCMNTMARLQLRVRARQIHAMPGQAC